MNGQAQMTFKVAGNCMITIGGCQFTGQNDQFVLKTTTGALDAVSKAAKTAKTGDNSPILAYVFGAMAGALILGVSFLKKRKKTNN